MRSASIVGIGTWLPEAVRRNSDWPEDFARRAAGGDRTFNDIPRASSRSIAAIAEKYLDQERDPFLGAELRHVADPGVTAVDSSVAAAREAVRASRVHPGKIDLVLSNCVVPDGVGPITAPAVAHAVGADRARAFDMDAACASAIMQLEAACSFVESGAARSVLCTQSHLMLRTVDMSHPASPGLGDGASAFVVTASELGLVVRGHWSRTHGEFVRAVVWKREERGDSAPWHQPGSAFRLGTLQPEFVKSLMQETIRYGRETVIEAASVAMAGLDDISVLASVQPRGYLPGAIAESLGLPFDAAVTTYRRVAHLGACGPVFNLKEAVDVGALRPGRKAALYGQGAGFTVASAVLESV